MHPDKILCDGTTVPRGSSSPVFIGTQNRLVTLHSSLIKSHEETDISPRSTVGHKFESTLFLPCSRTIGTWSPRSSTYGDVFVSSVNILTKAH
jgi:hypothetical protein